MENPRGRGTSSTGQSNLHFIYDVLQKYHWKNSQKYYQTCFTSKCCYSCCTLFIVCCWYIEFPFIHLPLAGDSSSQTWVSSIRLWAEPLAGVVFSLQGLERGSPPLHRLPHLWLVEGQWYLIISIVKYVVTDSWPNVGGRHLFYYSI